jgi:hypothetical protein
MTVKMNTKLADIVRRAAIDAVNETVDAAAQDAQSHHGWDARRGRRGLQGQVKVEPARVENGVIKARFGSTQVRGFYGLILERRHPWLRPAADRHFPDLSKRIADKL